MNINHTRTMVRAALNGELDDVATRRDPIFGVEVPTEVPGVPSGILEPRSTWADGDAYDAQAAKLARMFADNFRSYADGVPPSVREAGPRRGRRRRPRAGAGGSRRGLRARVAPRASKRAAEVGRRKISAAGDRVEEVPRWRRGHRGAYGQVQSGMTRTTPEARPMSTFALPRKVTAIAVLATIVIRAPRPARRVTGRPARGRRRQSTRTPPKPRTPRSGAVRPGARRRRSGGGRPARQPHPPPDSGPASPARSARTPSARSWRTTDGSSPISPRPRRRTTRRPAPDTAPSSERCATRPAWRAPSARAARIPPPTATEAIAAGDAVGPAATPRRPTV